MPSLSAAPSQVTFREHSPGAAIDAQVARLEIAIAAMRNESATLRGRSKVLREESKHITADTEEHGKQIYDLDQRLTYKEQHGNMRISSKCCNQAMVSCKSNEDGMQEDFSLDLMQFVKDVSERFHVKVFFLEVFGQFAYTFLGIISVVILFFVYGPIGMKNRGFMPGGFCMAFALQNIVATSIMVALFLWLYGCSEEVSDAEVKSAVFMAWLRAATIAFKYAFMTTSSYQELNEMIWSSERLTSLLIIGAWDTVTVAASEAYIETSCVTVLGTKRMRSRLSPCFLPWPKTGHDAAWFRTRVDKTTKRLILVPTGDIESTLHVRKVKTMPFGQETYKRISGAARQAREFTERVSGGVADFLEGRAARLASLADPHPTLVHGQDCETPASLLPDTESPTADIENVEYSLREESKPAPSAVLDVAGAAQRGEPIDIEELFRFMVHSVQRSEAVMWPRLSAAFLRWLPLFACSLGPLLCRLRDDDDQLSMVYVGFVVANFIPCLLFTFGNMKFLEIGLKDFWRRRSLLRSCSALLTLERHCRRGCPAEVDQLPILDLTDPRSIEAWRKIRQLSMDWGHQFHKRVQGFASCFAGSCMVLAVDLLLSLQVEQYEKYAPVTLQKIIIYLSIFCSIGLVILIIVYLGQEINDLSAQHVLLLRRQRTILLSSEHIKAVEAAAVGRELPLDGKAMRSAEFIAALCEDLDDEARANPVKLLGLYCGYSLLSLMYFIPAGLTLSLLRFCTNTKTSFKCTGTSF